MNISNRNIFILFPILAFVVFGLPILDRYEVFFLSLIFLVLLSIKELKSKINIILIFFLLSLTLVIKFLNNDSIKETHGIYLPNINNNLLYQNNHKVFFSLLKKNFYKNYSKVNIECNSLDITCWNDIKLDNYFSKSFDNGFFIEKNVSRIVNSIKHDSLSNLRIGDINNKNLSFYNSNNENAISRFHAPYYVIYDFSNFKKKGSEICWSNNAILINKNKTEHNKNKGCLIVDNETLIGFFNFGDGLSIYLNKNNFDTSLEYLETFSKFLFFLILLSLIINKLDKIKLINLSLILFLSNIVYYFIVHSKPEYNFGYYPLQGGMDGLVHEGFGRLITNYFYKFNMYDFLRGGEDIYYFMPGMRYFSYVEKLLFGDTFNGIYLICVFIPLVFFIFLKSLGIKSFFSLIICILFIFLKIDHLGFSYNYLTKISLAYYPEAIALFCFMISIILYKRDFLKLSIFFMFLMVFMRPNYLPTFFIFFILNNINIIRNSEFNKLFFFLIASSPILVYPLHNFFFSNGQFVILTSSMTINENLIVKPSSYINIFKTSTPNEIIINQLYGLFTAGSKTFHILIINCLLLLNLIYFLLIKRKNYLWFFFLIIILQFIPMLFYSTAIRYSYFPWFLITVSNLIIINNYLKKRDISIS